MDKPMITMYDSSCHLCRLGVFPHQAGGKVKLNSFDAVPHNAKIHLGGSFNTPTRLHSYQNWRDTQDRSTPLVTIPPKFKSIETMEAGHFKKVAYFKMFAARLENMRRKTDEAILEQMRMDMDYDGC